MAHVRRADSVSNTYASGTVIRNNAHQDMPHDTGRILRAVGLTAPEEEIYRGSPPRQPTGLAGCAADVRRDGLGTSVSARWGDTCRRTAMSLTVALVPPPESPLLSNDRQWHGEIPSG